MDPIGGIRTTFGLLISQSCWYSQSRVGGLTVIDRVAKGSRRRWGQGALPYLLPSQLVRATGLLEWPCACQPLDGLKSRER